METASLNPKVDAYFGKVRPFAEPIMWHLRELIHKGCPGVAETIKWSRPFFEYKGMILCNISAFNEHCSMGFWGGEIGAILREAGVVKEGAMGSLGRITTLADLPSDKLMLGWIHQARGFIDSGQYTSPIAARHKVVKSPKLPMDTLRTLPLPSRRTRTPQELSPSSAPRANANIPNGLSTPSVWKRARNASPLRSSG